MNVNEEKIITILKDLKQNYNVAGVKAEFESEGASFEEVRRLKELIIETSLDLTLKIGGCGAINDLNFAKSVGVSRIVAPMIESSYALRKFLASVKFVFASSELSKLQLFINIETISAFNNLDAILNADEINEISGIVLGRSDMAESMELPKKAVSGSEIAEIARNVFVKAREKSLLCGVGGAVCTESFQLFKDLSVDFYETRKVIFNNIDMLEDKASDGIIKAFKFEQLWLQNEIESYGKSNNLNQERLKLLEEKISCAECMRFSC